MTEDELLAAVLLLAGRLRLLAAHVEDSRALRAGAGFPDLVLAGPGGILFAELKSASGDLSTAQRRWRWMIQAAGGRWRLWRPAHWEAGLIEREMKEITT